MKILLSISSWAPANGGSFAAVNKLSTNLSAFGNEVHLITVNYPNMPAYRSPEGVNLHLIEGRFIPGVRQTFLLNGRRRINALIEKIQPDIIHDNGLWLTLNHEIALAAKRYKILRIVTPMGMLNPWALEHGGWKKKVALKLYQKKDLELADAFHATSTLEAKNIRKFGLKQKVMIIPHGVDLHENISFFEPKNYRTALFLGRLHPVKNLPNLICAWAKVRPKQWKLKLVGSDEVNHRQMLEKLSAQLGVNDYIQITGPIYDDAKEFLLAEAQLAFLVSKSENFGIAAAEALAAETPVIASKDVPWDFLDKENIGWCVEGNVDSLAVAIAEATSLPKTKLQMMGVEGRRYAKEHFSWNVVTKQFLDGYQKFIRAN